jgi:hypothetical protein
MHVRDFKSGKLSTEARNAVVNYLVRCGNAEWEDETHTRCRIFWKSPKELAAEIYAFVMPVIDVKL